MSLHLSARAQLAARCPSWWYDRKIPERSPAGYKRSLYNRGLITIQQLNKYEWEASPEQIDYLYGVVAYEWADMMLEAEGHKYA